MSDVSTIGQSIKLLPEESAIKARLDLLDSERRALRKLLTVREHFAVVAEEAAVTPPLPQLQPA